MWKKTRIDELLQGRDGRIRTVSLLLFLPDITKISRHVQLVIPVEIDKGGGGCGGLKYLSLKSLMSDP